MYLLPIDTGKSSLKASLPLGVKELHHIALVKFYFWLRILPLKDFKFAAWVFEKVFLRRRHFNTQRNAYEYASIIHHKS
jgi:hypothetical protein